MSFMDYIHLFIGVCIGTLFAFWAGVYVGNSGDLWK